MLVEKSRKWHLVIKVGSWEESNFVQNEFTEIFELIFTSCNPLINVKISHRFHLFFCAQCWWTIGEVIIIHFAHQDMRNNNLNSRSIERKKSVGLADRKNNSSTRQCTRKWSFLKTAKMNELKYWTFTVFFKFDS